MLRRVVLLLLVCALTLSSCCVKDYAGYNLVIYSSESTFEVEFETVKKNQVLSVKGLFEHQIELSYTDYSNLNDKKVKVKRKEGNDTIFIFAAGIAPLANYNGDYLSGDEIIKKYSIDKTIPIDSLSRESDIQMILPTQKSITITPTYYIKFR